MTPEESPAARAAARRLYWRRLKRLTAVLLMVWVLATFGVAFFARQLNAVTVLGFPLGFYMSAQGSLLIYVALVAAYAVCATRIEKLAAPPDRGSP